MTDIQYEERGRIAIVTLNRPDALNALRRELRLGVVEAFERCARAEQVRAVVLTGAAHEQARCLESEDCKERRAGVLQ